MVECKDYDKVVGIGVIRDFYGVVSQIKPNQSIVISSKGFTKGAIDFANDEGISFAILREHKDSDWSGIIRRIDVKIEILLRKNEKISIEGKPVNNEILEKLSENSISDYVA